MDKKYSTGGEGFLATIVHVLKIPNIFSTLENTRLFYTSYSVNKENFLNNQNIVSKALLIFAFR